ncbi:hypothetical protein M3Y97_01001700 [Aphelenchoides bicaudatus]|nr:hypothetical protein M3Y97_01001700 [Aphelenchoides bicaudatus]
MIEEGHGEKVLLASASVAIGVGCLIALIVLLTVLPDCRGHISSNFLTIFAIQCTVHLILLLVNVITLSYTLATYTNTFINDAINNAPGYIVIFCLSTAACMQLYLSCRRFLDYSFPYLFERLPTRTLTFAVLICAFLFGSNRFVNYVFADRTLNYKLEGLRWMYSTRSSEENFYLSAAVGFSMAFILLLFTIAVVFTLIKSASKDTTKKERVELFKDILWLTACLILDALYAGLIIYCHYRAVPSKFLHVPIIAAFHDGCIQSFVLVIFPVISTFFSDDILRQALWHRTGGFLTGTPPMSPTFPRRSCRTYSRDHEVLPMFMQRDSLADQHRKISLPPPGMRKSLK